MPHGELQQSSAVFQAGHGSTVQIQGGQFVQHNHAPKIHNCREADDGFKHLLAHVATSAFDSPEHVDAPKCHPNTRKAVLDEIMNWIILTVARTRWILWLNGAAGAGKSAIGRSIVDLCIDRNIPMARFFFFRTDATRNNVTSLVATLVYQLLQRIPDLEPIIIPRIKSDPLVFTKSLKTQFEFLLFGPLRELGRQSSHINMLILLFDGVDECDDKDEQANLIRIVADFVRSESFPAIAFFASRVENHISTVFRSASVSNVTLRLPLDDHYLPEHDIRSFLDDSFNEIKRTHPFSHLLSDNWPEASDVQEIVQKSSRQFIYASVVVKFCAMLDLHPEHQLKIVQGIRPRGALTPFAQLDALYQHIFSQVRDWELTSIILAWSLFTLIPWVTDCADFLGLQTADIHVALAPLQSVVDCTSDRNIRFLHASLPDFLLDRDRSQEFYLHRPSWSTRLSVLSYKFVMSKGDDGYVPLDMYLTDAEATPELQEQLLAFNPAMFRHHFSQYSDYLGYVQRLDFGDGPGGNVYKQCLNIIVRYVSQEVPAALRALGQAHNISHILREIENESRKEVNQEQQESKKKSWVPLEAIKAAWKLKPREANTQTAGIGRADEMQQEDGWMSSRPRQKSGILRLFKKQ